MNTTKEQAIADKKAKMKELADKFASLDESQRLEVSRKLGTIRNIEGNSLSLRNTFMLIYQRPSVSLVGGFQQWKKAGRIVRKGEKSLLILCPATRKASSEEATEGKDSNPLFFIGGNVFDISQTEPISKAEASTLSLLQGA